jgi:uncharacterized membrane protein YvbJ
MQFNWKERLKVKRLLTPLIILLSLIVFFFMSTMMVLQEKTLLTFQEALINKDVDQLQALLSSEDQNFIITTENVERFLTYLDSFKKDKESLLESIKLGQNHELLSINTQKKWMFFEDYVFQVKPFFIEFTIDEFVKEIEIVGVETLQAEGLEKIRSGPLMPGTYDIVATHHMGYVPDYTSNNKIAAIPAIANEERVIRSGIGTKYIVFRAYNALGGTVFINGKETQLIIDNDEQKIYGVPTDGSITLSVKKKFPWGEFTTEEVVVSGKETFVHLDSTNEEVTKQVLAVANEFAASWVEAFNKQDPSLLKHVTPEMRESMESKMTNLYEVGILTLTKTDVQKQIETFLLSIEGAQTHELPIQKEYYTASISIVEYFGDNGTAGSVYVLYYNLVEGKWLFYKFHSPGAY